LEKPLVTYHQTPYWTNCAFLNQQYFNYIIGNNDMHLKNYSMFLSEMGWDTYWENGALKSDLHDEIALIEWTVDRKVKTITRTTGSTLPDLEFWYDAMGRRLVKIEKPRPGGSPSAAKTYGYTPDISTMPEAM
jgi:hypothetical protein